MPTLDWIGKRAVVNHHRELPYRLLHCEREASAGDAGGGNLLVEGDNLHALKALLPYYAGQVKCIYIDPPYNTGNEGWVYNDNVNAPEIQKWLGDTVGKEAEDLSRHDKWLCMMYPRLALLREFLREDGSIWISIDDNEVASLRLLMDAIFGGNNFIATIAWQKIYTVKNSAKHLSEMHDYVVVYGVKKNSWLPNLAERTAGADSNYANPDNDPRGVWTSNALQSRNYYSKGTYSITCPGGRLINGPPAGTYWRMEETKLWELHADNRVWWGRNRNNSPRIKKFLSEAKQGMVPTTWWTHQFAGTNSGAKTELRAILGDFGTFITPKPKELLERILQIATKPGDLILDSFAGSGTTGHAVLKLNKEGGRSRHFILVELESRIAHDITAERLKRVINGYGDTPGLGGSFRYCTLGEPLFDAEGRLREDVKWGDLAHHLWFAETGEPWSPTHRLGEEQQSLSTGGPLIGITSEGRAIYLLYSSLLQGEQRNRATTLSSDIVDSLAAFAGLRVVYADACTLRASALSRERIAFKQIPYQIRQQ